MQDQQLPNLFFSYSHADGILRDQLEKQLAMLKRQGVITAWHDHRIEAGQELDNAISLRMEEAGIILLLVSPDFLASDYCYNREMVRAMERHEAGDAIVIPVILRACDWHGAPFGKLKAVPTDGKPITQWPDRDQAMLEVAKAVRRVAERAASKLPLPAKTVPAVASEGFFRSELPRSSNLRLAKQFSERDRDRFQIATFEYMANFFENSLAELSIRNRATEGVFRRIDANRFTATIYQEGEIAARCTIFIGGQIFGSGICYVSGETMRDNSYNEVLNVNADEHDLFLSGMGMSAISRQVDGRAKLSQEGAAEFYWEMLISPLQQRRS